jgi:hypothetical protein
MPAPVASGWSESPGGACTHWKSAALSRRTWKSDIRTRFLRELKVIVPPTPAERCENLDFCMIQSMKESSMDYAILDSTEALLPERPKDR